MDFAAVELSEPDRRFRDELREFLAAEVTDEVRRRDRETGENFVEEVHLALGAAGYLAGDYLTEAEGGFSPLRRRIFELEIGRAHTPWFHWGTTAMVARVLQRFGSPELADELLPGVLSGRTRLCLGYTEPEGGSDVATCQTRAVRDAAGDWVINGAKMFTSNAQNSDYVFLLTNTDPDGPKHRNLTMFLVPLASDGIEIAPLRTVDGDRTNVVYYSDVRVADRYRIGAVDGGWAVMRLALDVEHGTEADPHDGGGLAKLAVMTEHALLLAEAVDSTAGRLGAGDRADAHRLGRAAARLEAALSTPGMFGRVAIAQTLRDLAPELMDVLGAASALGSGTAGAADDGAAEYLFRLAGPTGIYGGTVEVFRNMIARHALGLPRPHYAPAGSSASTSARSGSKLK